jgi:hypothetical protein
MTICCYTFRKSKPIRFKTGYTKENITLKAYRLMFSHNSERENWGDHYDACDWQKKQSKKLKRLRTNSYSLRPPQFFVTFYDEKTTMLDLWAASPNAQKAWDDCDELPGVWFGKLTKKESGRGWDYHSRNRVKDHVADLIKKAFMFIGQNPDLESEETSEKYFDRLQEAQYKDPDHKEWQKVHDSKPWDRDSQMRSQRHEIENWGQNFWYRERNSKERKTE